MTSLHALENIEALPNTHGKEFEMTHPHHSDDILGMLTQLGDFVENPTLKDFIGELPKNTEQRRDCEPKPLPVLTHLDVAVRSSPPASRPLLEFLSRFRATLHWGQTYNAGDLGAEFLKAYGWTEFVGLRGPISSETVACGVLFLGPSTEYPSHSHQAEEVYVPLSGTACWQMGDGAWAERAPLEVIHHQSRVPHAMRTGKDPLIALYFWRGGDLRQKSRLGDPVAPRH